ncbi:transmembrane protein, putative (macronuclear) [Tetrahymena thermophila SB210]|uniref:Transmembrane protein, putative n=1 Tax=Tetrahymena thermophila (strain SB210) TaxID=312017 RepID=W7XF19_TETTS|nr:transmembrane protein, putative [Tetrahymena thermophila SB210]EWS75373.1 transmembrane protein, putative [Tetrahymena thermophila SB210]|eukprot:XP_012652047.1 transmembrane protein, putative [Tetrahymena thermophila SB210]
MDIFYLGLLANSVVVFALHVLQIQIVNLVQTDTSLVIIILVLNVIKLVQNVQAYLHAYLVKINIFQTQIINALNVSQTVLNVKIHNLANSANKVIFQTIKTAKNVLIIVRRAQAQLIA